MFYALEQKSLRQSPDAKWPVKALSYFYDLTAKYGQSFLRPFIGLFLLSLSFSLFYWEHDASPLAGDWPKALDFTVTQIVRPFSVWTANYNPAITTGWKLLASL